MAEYYTAQGLPESNTVEAGYLESMLDNFSASYKLYWFRGILTEVMKGNCILEYKRIVARMIASAWYPVVYFNLSLGHSDKLSEAIWYMNQVLGIEREEKEESIVEFVCRSQDKALLKMVKDFTNMVPFRLIRPFYQVEIEYEKKKDPNYNDKKANAIIEKYNRNDADRALYIMDRLNQKLTVLPKWSGYLKENAAVVNGWLNYKLIYYLQQRNPNVPAIPLKIFPPVKRNLADASNYWELVQDREHMPEIYTKEEFTENNIRKFGSISIDHFIPWSFVLHDEIWNLCPVFKDINSKKGNKLPEIERYLQDFCEYHYRAFLASANIDKVKRKIMQQYLTVRKDVFQIKDSDRGHDAFVNSMKQTIEPLYRIANNQGYGIWWYENPNEKPENSKS